MYKFLTNFKCLFGFLKVFLALKTHKKVFKVRNKYLY